MSFINGTLASIDVEKQYEYGVEPYKIVSRIIRCGRDFIFVFGGGSSYHTGAVAVGITHPSIKDNNNFTTTASIITVPGHKEDLLARSAALELSKLYGTTVTVCVGLHMDQATKDDIQIFENNFINLLKIISIEFNNSSKIDLANE